MVLTDSFPATLRPRHHAMARLIAIGMPQIKIAEALNVSPPYISRLKRNPQFRRLTAFYAEQDTQTFMSAREHTMRSLHALGRASVDKLQERIEADVLSNKELRETMAAALDRAGFSPVNRQEVSSTKLSADDLARIKSKMAER